MFGIIALLLCASAATADYVVDWRVPVANDANANVWVAEVVVPVGEKVVLEWTDYMAFHNVFRMKDKAAYDACDFDGAVELAPSAATGSVAIDATETTTYYACEIGDGFHCENGQKLSVTGSDAVVENDDGAALPPTPEPTMMMGDGDMPGHGDGDMPGHGDGGHDHGGGHGGDAECTFDAPESKPFGPCQMSDTYPLFCTAAEAEAMSPSNGYHMMAGLFMPNGVMPMCHGNYVGDAAACECDGLNNVPPDFDVDCKWKNGKLKCKLSDGARAVSGAAAAALTLAALLL